MKNKKYVALFLFLVTPIIAEYTLGNVPLHQSSSLAAYPILALLYGGGAVIIRELVRKTGRGYLSMLFLALAYGLFEEGIVLQTLFNSNYLSHNLHEYGNIPFLGMGGPWTIFVLHIHSIWSIMVPIIITESLFPQYKKQPWLGKSGQSLYLSLCLLGGVLWGFMTFYEEKFMASFTQLASVGIVIVILVFLAFKVSAQNNIRGETISPKVAGIIAFVSGSIFILLFHFGESMNLFGPTVYLVSVILLLSSTYYILIKNGRRAKWTQFHSFSVAGGLALVYSWCGFIIQISLYGINPIGMMIQLLLVGFVITILVKARTRLAMNQ